MAPTSKPILTLTFDATEHDDPDETAEKDGDVMEEKAVEAKDLDYVDIVVAVLALFFIVWSMITIAQW